MTVPPATAHGLAWISETFGLKPVWTVEPSTEAIRQTLQKLYPTAAGLEVNFLAQGAFNKLYAVTLDDAPQPVIMRVSLPVDPGYKTRSEVATLDWVRRHTALPVPKVIAYDASRGGAVGFEWILMERVSGRPLADEWRGMAWEGKVRVVKQIAGFHACVFRRRFEGVGSLYPELGDDAVGRIVSMFFYWGERLAQDVHRGPFRCGREWLEARLLLSETECLATLGKHSGTAAEDMTSDDEDDVDDAERTLRVVRSLKDVVQKILPRSEAAEPTVLLHDDLSKHNILVQPDGTITGVVDWECVSAVPLWRACTYPSFLEGGRLRDAKPDVGRYEAEQSSGGEEKPSELYYEHLEEWECTQLRGVFLGEMRVLEPGWTEVYERSRRERDLETAVLGCDGAFVARDIHAWIDDVEAGKAELQSLWDRIDGI